MRGNTMVSDADYAKFQNDITESLRRHRESMESGTEMNAEDWQEVITRAFASEPPVRDTRALSQLVVAASQVARAEREIAKASALKDFIKAAQTKLRKEYPAALRSLESANSAYAEALAVVKALPKNEQSYIEISSDSEVTEES